jgi:uncharacterized 2Fe-2S/4Fe-4S cluster protein (DUF4445 family)
MSESCEIHFLPDDRTAAFEAGTLVSEAAARADILIEQPCGGRGRCGKCRVRFVENAPAPSAHDERTFTPGQLGAGWRLACLTRIEQPVAIEVPSVSRAASGKTFGPADLFAPGFERAITAQALAVDLESLGDQASVLERVARAAGRSGIPAITPAVLRDLAQAAAEGSARIGLIWDEDTLRAIVPADSADRHRFGAALDLGTTTVAGALIDLRDGATLAVHSALNAQVQFGADVVSRITYTMEHADGTARLQQAAIETLRAVIEALCRDGQIDPREIVALAVVGNSTMEHLLLGVPPVSLGVAPYVGAWRGERVIPAAHLRLGVHAKARVWVTPMVRSNVGGDTTGAMLAVGMDRDDRLRLLIDLGTNAEVVLGSARRRLACSTAAGPAFEGANISQGMRAAPGAIDSLVIHEDGTVVVHVVGEVAARGICGSGLIDVTAELLRAGAIDGRGWLRSPAQIDRSLPEAVARRIVTNEKGMNAFVLAQADEAADGRAVLLTAGDVRQVQLVKGSIAAGTEILCREMGVAPGDIEEILIAGAFGNYVRRESALAIGLVPRVEPERVRFVGNAAGIGARMVLADREARRRALALADATEYVELAGRLDYQAAFARAMLFENDLF